MGTFLNILLVFVPIGILSSVLGWGDVPTFILNFFAIIPLAKLLGSATEEIAFRTGQTVGGCKFFSLFLLFIHSQFSFIYILSFHRSPLYVFDL